MPIDHTWTRSRAITRLSLVIAALAGTLLTPAAMSQIATAPTHQPPQTSPADNTPPREATPSRSAVAADFPTSIVPPLMLAIAPDLIYMKIVEEVRAHLVQADADDRPMVVLLMGVKKWRPDVVLALVRAVRDSKVPVAVQVCNNDPTCMPSASTYQVPTGPLVIGLAARFCIVCPDVEFTQTPSNLELSLAPEKTDWELINTELWEETVTSLRRRGVAEETAEPLARALLTPRDPLLLTPNADASGKLRVWERTEAPDRAATLLSITQIDRDGQPVTKLDRPTARWLGMIDAEVFDMADWMRKTKVSARPPDQARVVNLGDKLSYMVPGYVKTLDRHLDDAQKRLDLPDPKKRSVSKDTYKQASREAAETLAKAEASLSSAEQSLKDFPEFLRTPPPGQTDVAAKPSSYAAKWRSMIQSRRDKLTKLRAKAEEFAAQ